MDGEQFADFVKTDSSLISNIPDQNFAFFPQGIMYEISVSMELKICHGSLRETACLPISLTVIPSQRLWTAWSNGTETRC